MNIPSNVFPPTVFPMKSIERKELYQYYEDFDVNAKTVVDQMSGSLKGVVDNKVFSTSHRIADDPSAFSEYFDSYDVGWQWNSGTHVQLYNISEFADKNGIELENPEVFSYTNLGEERVYVFKMKNGNRYEVRQTPPLENPMESEVFKNTVGKAFITLCNNYEQLDNARGHTVNNRPGVISIEYDPSTKSINTKKFIEKSKEWMNRALTFGDERGKGLSLAPEYLEGILKQLETDLQELFKEIL